MKFLALFAFLVFVLVAVQADRISLYEDDQIKPGGVVSISDKVLKKTAG